MTKSEFEEFVEKVSVKGSIYGLESIKALLARMDNPEKRLRFVHIAGTNGKGSVLAFTSTILKYAGSVTAEQAKLHAETEFEKYRIIQDKIYESDFDKMLKKLEGRNE